jgi:hypothetical protein
MRINQCGWLRETEGHDNERLFLAVDGRDNRHTSLMKQDYKGNSCSEKHCLACSATPPTLSSNAIKNLRITFAKMAPEEVSDAVLHRKGKSKVPKASQAPSKNSKAKSKKSSADEDTPRKKSKKKASGFIHWVSLFVKIWFSYI